MWYLSDAAWNMKMVTGWQQFQLILCIEYVWALWAFHRKRPSVFLGNSGLACFFSCSNFILLRSTERYMITKIEGKQNPPEAIASASFRSTATRCQSMLWVISWLRLFWRLGNWTHSVSVHSTSSWLRSTRAALTLKGRWMIWTSVSLKLKLCYEFHNFSCWIFRAL